MVFTSNSTAVHEVFDRCLDVWDSVYKSRAYVHIYEQDGIAVHDLMESRNIVKYISEQYKEFATWPDKLYEDAGTKNVGDDREVENPALMGQEEKLIVDELRALKKGEMYIHQVKA